jgi:hypothetical protein
MKPIRICDLNDNDVPMFDIVEYENEVVIFMDTGWHDAKTDPPKEDTRLIAELSNGWVCIATYYTHTDYLASDNGGQRIEKKYFVRWMPLPEPSKESEHQCFTTGDGYCHKCGKTV